MANAFSDDVSTYIRAGYPIINILSGEEDRVIDLVDETLLDPEKWPNPRRLFIWSIIRGFVDITGQPVDEEKTNDPPKALNFMAGFNEPAVFVFKDFYPYIKEGAQNSSLLIRMIRDIVPVLQSSPKTMIWTSSTLYIPPELEKEITVLDMPLPGQIEYLGILEGIIRSVKDNPRVEIDLTDEDRDKLVSACQGLTRNEAENALAKTIVSRGQLKGADVTAILAEKEQIIRKSGILEYTATVDDFNNVGGLGALKQWLRQRKAGFSQKARDFGLPYPRGVMLVGVPGCGKSLCAKAVAAEWQMPLLRFDLGRVFAGRVGESEENMRKALSVAESVAPAILWIDELEKGVSGIGDGGDSGVGSRVFGNLLTWMEEKEKPVFVVATGNDIERLPPELLRKGRVDEIFFVGLPGPEERAEILMIHLGLKNRDPQEFEMGRLVEATDGFSGAEIEELVISGLYEAFDDKDNDKLKTDHLMSVIGEIIPLSKSSKDRIAELEKWAGENCRMAVAPRMKKAEEAVDLADRRARISRKLDF